MDIPRQHCYISSGAAPSTRMLARIAQVGEKRVSPRILASIQKHLLLRDDIHAGTKILSSAGDLLNKAPFCRRV